MASTIFDIIDLKLIKQECFNELIKSKNIEEQAKIAVKYNEQELLFEILETGLVFIPDISPTIIDYKNLDLLKLLIEKYSIMKNSYVVYSDIHYAKQIKDCEKIVDYLSNLN